MKKFFQKHKNIIMAIVSVGLMLSFSLLGSKPKTEQETRNTPAGSLNGQKVTQGELDNAKGEVELLAEFDLMDRSGTFNVRDMWRNQGGDDAKIGLFWYLICQDAQRYVHMSISGAAAVQQAATNTGRSEQEILNRLNSASVSQEGLALALSHYLEFKRFIEFLATFPPPLSQVELAGDRQLRILHLSYLPIDATQGWKDIPDKDVEGDVAAQYEAYKDVVATHIPGPEDPPFFLGTGTDDKGTYAMVGYPGKLAAAAHLYSGDTIAWDGSKIDIVPPGSFIGFDASGNPVGTPVVLLEISGGGRTQPVRIPSGFDIHGGQMPQTKGADGKHHDHTFPFGYKSPDMVKVEYLVFPRQGLRGRLSVTETIDDLAIEAYKKDPYKFRTRPGATQPATAPGLTVAAPTSDSQPATTSSRPATTTATATATAATASQPVPTTQETNRDWDENPAIRQPYFDEQLNARTTVVLKKLVESARAKADSRWNGAEAPEPSEWVSYDALAQSVGIDAAEETGRVSGIRRWVNGLGFGPYSPVVKATTDFMSVDDLVKIPGIGHALFQNAQGVVFDFPTLASHVKQLVETDKTAPLGRLNLEVGHEPPEVTDAQGNVYLFRVTAIRKSQAAPLTDPAVKAQVVEDCKKLRAYKAVVAALTPPQKAADLQSLAATYHSEVHSPGPFSRDGRPDLKQPIAAPPAEVRNIPGFVEAAFSLPAPGSSPSVAVVQDEQSLMIYPVRVNSVDPPNGNIYYELTQNLGLIDQKRDLYSSVMWQNEALGTFLRNYLKVQTIAARLKFTLPDKEAWPVRVDAANP